MIPLTHARGLTIALVGLGGSGLSTARALEAGGAHVVAWDDHAAARDKAAAEGIEIADLRDADWTRFASLVLAPGVPLTHPAPHWSVLLAHDEGVEVIGDIELFCRERRAIAPGSPFVAITGTNGKSTTTALTAHLFRALGMRTQMGGNIGVPVLDLAAPAPDVCHVLECSSYQIDLAPSLDPSVGVLLNITPDHLDRHGSMAHYAAVKARLAQGSAHAVIGVDDDHTRAIADALASTPTRITVLRRDLPGAIVLDGARLVRDGAALADLATVASLRGAHNAQNAAAAIAALGPLADDRAALQRALESFPGLAHRMENVARVGRVLFVNDSKATNADAAQKALLSFDDIFWIVGGEAKEGGIEPLRPLFPRIAKAYLIGAAADAFARTLGAVPHEHCGVLDVAVARANADAQATQRAAVVLLAPACASFDQFRNFEVRGDAFRAAVRALQPGEGACP